MNKEVAKITEEGGGDGKALKLNKEVTEFKPQIRAETYANQGTVEKQLMGSALRLPFL